MMGIIFFLEIIIFYRDLDGSRVFLDGVVGDRVIGREKGKDSGDLSGCGVGECMESDESEADIIHAFGDRESPGLEEEVTGAGFGEKK